MSHTKSGMSNIQIVLIAVVAVLVGWGLIYFATKNAKDPNKIPSTDEIKEQVDETLNTAREQARQEFVQEEIDAYTAMLGELSEFLSDQGKADAQLVLNFVQENPTVIYDPNVEVPQDVTQAYRSLSQEVEEIKQSVGYTQENETGQESQGNTATITGVLEVSELSQQGVGTMFKITDENDGFNYYFILNNSETDRMFSENLVENRVSVNVEITGTVSGGVTYKVLNGPNLAQ